MREFFATYQEKILPPRNLSKTTLDLYRQRLSQAEIIFGPDRSIGTITLQECAAVFDSMNAWSSNQMRKLLVDVFAHAVAKGLMDTNPADLTIAKIEHKVRKPHTVEGLRKIYNASPDFLQNAIDMGLLTTQRREDIALMRFDAIRDGCLYVAQLKTEQSDAAWLEIEITPQLQEVIDRCRDDVLSPFLIHRRPKRVDSIRMKTIEHWTQVTPTYLSHAFQKARGAATPYPDLSPEEQPGFHEIRGLALGLYKKAGKSMEERKNLAGYSDEKMTKNYEAGQHDIV